MRSESKSFLEGFLSCLNIFETARDSAKAHFGEEDPAYRILNAVVGPDILKYGKLLAECYLIDVEPGEIAKKVPLEMKGQVDGQ